MERDLERDLDHGLNELALLIRTPPVLPEEDLARGRRHRRRHRLVLAGSAVAAVAMTGALLAVVPGVLDGPDREPVAVAAAFPTAEDPDRLYLEELILQRVFDDGGLFKVAPRVLDPEARYVRSITGPPHAPVMRWLQPGMTGPGTIEARLLRGEAGDGWTCTGECGSYVLRGRSVQYGMTHGGVRVLSWAQPDGDVVQVHLHPDLPEDLAIDQRRLEALLTLELLDAPRQSSR